LLIFINNYKNIILFLFHSEIDENNNNKVFLNKDYLLDLFKNKDYLLEQKKITNTKKKPLFSMD